MGLERMLLSAISHVDEIVIGVDGRSDEETLRVAQAYADCVFVFEGADIGMTPEEWEPGGKNPRGKIHFAAARNLGRARVRAPWTLVLDSDEHILARVDIRSALTAARPDQGAFKIGIAIIEPDGKAIFHSRDYQRIARTHYRWVSDTHNQLVCTNCSAPEDLDVEIAHDTSLRTLAEQTEREAQREVGIEDLVEQAAKGNLNALFHLAKHRAGAGDIEEAVRVVEDFRLRVEPNSGLAFQRQWVALGIAFRFYNADNPLEANRWACRALLDGPCIAAFCVLGDIAESEGDLPRALNWYEAACAVSDIRGITWPGVTETRWGRLGGIRRALLNAAGPDSAPAASGKSPTSGT